MSVGYALFSDTITINGTATAKGEDVIDNYFQELDETDTIYGNEKAKSIYKEFGYKEEQSELLVKKIK